MLAQLQTLLTDFYDLDVSHDVADFLITDEKLAVALDGGARQSDEKLLIAENGIYAEVSLFLHADLMERLAGNDPVSGLNGDNLADFWTAFEGVSHFIYFAWRASIDMPMTLFEMELQAEIDKFVATALLLRQQGERPPKSLHHWLFELPSFARNLDAEQLARYERANYYAAKYCEKLWPKLEREREELLQRELRRFYRLPNPAKIGHIEAC